MIQQLRQLISVSNQKGILSEMNKYKIKKTNKLIKQLKSYWKKLIEIESQHSEMIYRLEKSMEEKTGIKGIEFFTCDNEYVGIGNSERTMELIQRRKLEDE